MNRRERRNMEKQLGLHKFHQKETREQKWERWRSNQENGRRMMEDMRNEVERSIQEQDEEKMNSKIAGLAEIIAKRKEIPMIDAMVEAKQQYENSNV